MAKHVLTTPFGPVDAGFSWFSWTPAAAPPASPSAAPRLPGRRRATARIPASTVPADRPDLDTLRRVLAALHRL